MPHNTLKKLGKENLMMRSQLVVSEAECTDTDETLYESSNGSISSFVLDGSEYTENEDSCGKVCNVTKSMPLLNLADDSDDIMTQGHCAPGAYATKLQELINGLERLLLSANQMLQESPKSCACMKKSNE